MTHECNDVKFFIPGKKLASHVVFYCKSFFSLKENGMMKPLETLILKVFICKG